VRSARRIEQIVGLLQQEQIARARPEEAQGERLREGVLLDGAVVRS
jgi:hypothetical protein